MGRWSLDATTSDVEASPFTNLTIPPGPGGQTPGEGTPSPAGSAGLYDSGGIDGTVVAVPVAPSDCVIERTQPFICSYRARPALVPRT